MLKSSSSLFANSILLHRCKSMSKLFKTHALLITLDLSEEEPFASRTLSFSALSSSGDVDYAYKFLSKLSNPPDYGWNFVIRGYSNSRNPEKTIHVYIQMLRTGFLPDHMTYPFLLKSSSRLSNRKIGGTLHCSVVKTGFVWDLFICNSLIHMYGSFRDRASARKLFDEMPVKNLVTWNSVLDGYAKCGDVVSTRQVFDEMTERDVVSWSSMVDGYVKSGEYNEALEIFDQMMRMGSSKANEVTMVSVLCACAHLGALNRGKTVHRYLLDECLPLTVILQTSLIDMYAKCGSIGDAWAVFCGAFVKETDVLMWNTMIGGLANHGFIRESLQLFPKMRESKIDPDEIMFLCLLAACSHSGLGKEAWHLFASLKEKKVLKYSLSRLRQCCQGVGYLTAGKLLHEFKSHEGQIQSLYFHPHEFLLATGSADKTVKFWDLETVELIGSGGTEISCTVCTTSSCPLSPIADFLIGAD